jgi:4-amino-4-deoxy-L-arabinose transferase-like glycosyltransferase
MRFAPVLFAALCALVLFTGLGRVGFVDWREARGAVVAGELVTRREVLTPTIGSRALFEKPVVGYALDVVAQWFRPGSARDSRLLRALAAVALLLLTASIGAQHFGGRAGWIAAGVLASSLAFPLAARTDGTQLLATLFGWAGCAGFADALFGRRGGRDARLLVAYGGLAAALACAGPLPALWPFLGLALYARLASRARTFRELRVAAGLVLMAGVALPWYGGMINRHGAEFIAHAPFFPYGIEARGSWLAALVLPVSFLVVGFFPWSASLPSAMAHAALWWRKLRQALPGAPRQLPTEAGVDPLSRELREESASHFFLACLVAALVPIVLYPGPPLPAVLPALPAAALLCARFLDHLFEDAERVGAALTRAVLLLALTGSAGAVLLGLAAPRVREAAAALNLLAALVLVTSWAPFLANFIGRRRVAAALMALPVALGTPAVTLRLMPAMEDYLSARAVAEAAAAGSPKLAPIVLIDPAPPTLRLYTQRNLVLAASVEEALRKYPAADRLTYLAFRPAREREVARAAGAPLEILLRTPALVLARVRVRGG